MTKKVSRVLRSMLLVLMSLIFLAGGDFILPAGNVSAYAAQVKSKSVSKQKQLKKALKGKKNRKNRIITITKGGSYTIPAGTYTNVTINVRKKVRLNVRGKGLRIVLSEGARGSFVILNKKNTVEARCNATVRLDRNAGNSKIVANGNGNTVKVINKSSRKKLKIRTASGSRKVKKGNKNAIYLTAPKKQAVVSARSSAAKTAKAAGTVKPASHTAASGNQAGASSGKTPSTPAIEEKALLDAGRTRIVDLGFVKYVAVTFADGRSLDNTKILVDGADVSSVMTKVSDDGSVMKWEVSTLKPAQLVAVDRENDSVKTTVKLSDNAKPEIPEVKASEAPAYVLGYAPVAYWDYYLTNYDEDGKVRVHAAKTTFAKAGQSEAKAEYPYYSPDAEIAADGQGTVTIMFNYNTDDEKTWFDAIPDEGALELVSHDQYLNTLNGNLTYTKTPAVDHGQGQVGTFTIPAGQDNFRTNGRYFVRIRPASGKSILVPIHLVAASAPTLSLKEHTAIQPGQNIHFNVENLVYGIQDPTERVTLTGPDGKTKELTFIDDYFLMSQDLFVLYNDVTRDGGKGVNHTAVPGQYTITLEAAGFKPASCTFNVSGDSYVEQADEANAELSADAALALENADKTASGDDLMMETAELDAVSMATGFSGGSSSGTGSDSRTGAAGAISADLAYNVDLLVNAEIFDKLGLGNAYATAIVDRYESQMTAITAVYDATGTKYFDFSDYYNAVQKAAQNGNYLTFAQYSESGKAAGKSSKVKEVLEDNLLGDIQEDGSYTGLETPKLVLVDAEGNDVKSVAEGSDAYLTTEDPEAAADYLKKVSGLYDEINWYAPIDNTDNKSWAVEGDKLKISHELLKLASQYDEDPNVFTIKAEGYKDITVHITYEKALENVSLTVLNAEGELAAGSDVRVELTGSKGDFAKYIYEVLLQEGDGDARSVLTKSAGGDSGNDWYEFAEDESGNKTILVLKGGLFKKDADYTLTLKAQYYDELSVTFHVTGDKEIIDPSEPGDGGDPVEPSDPSKGGNEDPSETGTLKPAPAKLPELDSSNASSQGYFTLKAGSNDATEYAEWLKNITGVKVNDKDLSYDSSGYIYYASGYGITDSYRNVESELVLTKSYAVKDGANQITITAKGYQDMRLVLTQTAPAGGNWWDSPTYSLALATLKPAPAKLPELDSSNASSQGYFTLKAGSNDAAEYAEWLKNITGVKVNDKDLSYYSSGYIYNASGYGITDSYRNGESELVLTKSYAVEDGANQITITAEGYQDMRLVLTQTAPAGGSWWESPTYSLALAEEDSENAILDTAALAGNLAVDDATDENYAGELFSEDFSEDFSESETSDESAAEESADDSGTLEEEFDPADEEIVVEQ